MKPTAIVTGGAGFIGSHTVDLLVAEGWKVVVIDDLSTGNAHNVSSEAQLEAVDITNRTEFDRVIDSAKPTAIFHLAAQSSVTRSVADPRRDCEVNVLGTLNVLEAASRHTAHVVFTSTGGALYGNLARIPTPEDTFPRPVAPYGASKWAGEAYIATWREATQLPHTVCRLGNIYGPRQSPHGEAGVVSIFSFHLWKAQRPTLYGFGKATRDYVHAHDTAQALLKALGKGETFNVATGIETDVLKIFTVLQDAARTNLEPELAPLRAGELERSCMDPSRARDQLRWTPAITLESGLRDTYRALTEQFVAETVPAGS